MKTFNEHTFNHLSTSDRSKYIKECFPIGSKIYIDEKDKKRSHYVPGIFTVVGYNLNGMNDTLLDTDTRLTGFYNTIHPRYVKLHLQSMRRSKLSEILK